MFKIKSVSQGRILKQKMVYGEASVKESFGCKANNLGRRKTTCRELNREPLERKELKCAFSLVEMLMALLVASLLMAALAPVMTKKFNENVNVSGLATYKAPADMQCYSYSDLNPSIKVNINDVYTASFIIASGGGGGAGATSTKKIAATSIEAKGTSTSDTTKTITIDEYMTDVKVTLVGAGGGGAGGAGYVSGCPDETVEFKGNSIVKPFCITRYNVGEHKNNIQKRTQDFIPKCPNCAFFGANDISASYDSKCGGSLKGMCCWYSNNNTDLTANSDNQCSQSVGYNSCARTLCQYKAAQSGCDSFSYVPSGVQPANWSLPSSNQIIYLRDTYNSNILILGGGGVFLCSNNYLAGVDFCGMISQRCWGSVEGDHTNLCYPSALWVDEQKMIWMLNNPSLNAKGLYGPHSSNVASAFSARCTLDKTKLMKSYSGAGGAAGAYISELDITSYVKQAGAGGTIEIKAGKEGKGGDGATSNNTKGNNGTAGNLSQIIIKKQTGEIVYGIRTKGGNGGTAADSITVNGNEAINSNISTNNNCEYTLNGTTWNQTSCTKNILKGNNGNIIWATSATKGTGAISPITSNTLGNGAGGNGGTSSYGYNDKSTNENGENGKSGLVKITYNNEYAGAGGGGGGAGSVAHIKNFYLGKSSECTLTIGKGGKGGSVDNNGIDGGLSSVKCDNDPRTFEVPGGKGGNIGISAQNNTSNPTPGIKGLFGDVTKISNTAIKNYNQSKKVISNGLDGKDGAYNQTTKESIGGRGGTSGTGTKGACGGLYIENDEKEGICTVSETDNKRVEGKGFIYDDTLVPSPKDIQNTDNPSYGKAAAGGGGGGWTRNLPPGKGGDGMNGYVCVYWYNE